jgi:hypothetical protein
VFFDEALVYIFHVLWGKRHQKVENHKGNSGLIRGVA